MPTIDEGLVEQTWEAVRAYAPEEAKREATVFVNRQPHVVTFVRAFGEEFPESVRRLALGAVYFLFKVLEADGEEPLPTVPGVRLREAYQANLAWLEEFEVGDEEVDDRFLERRLQASGTFPQPNFLLYLLKVFYREDPGTGEFDREAKAHLFLLLKTVLDSLA
jgi:hypothetical protein